MIEDPRTQKEGLCGVTFTDSGGREWICIKKVHAKIYQRRNPKPGQSSVIFSEHGADNHYYVPRWPNRKMTA